MQNKGDKNYQLAIESNLALINLQLKATNLQNKNKLKDSLEALANFIGSKNQRSMKLD